MADVYTQITTPSGSNAPDILANANKVAVGQGASEGTLAGTKSQVSHGNLDATEAAPIDKNSTAYVFVSGDGTSAFLDDNEDGTHLPVAKAFRVGRAWRGADGSFVVCQGRRGAGVVEYNIGGDPVPRRLIDAGSSTTPTSPASPFQGAGRMTLDVSVTVKGTGTATVQVRDNAGKVVSKTTYGPGNNQPDNIVLGTVGDVLEYTTSDSSTTITMTVTKGTETI